MKKFDRFIGAVLTVCLLLCCCGCGADPVTSEVFDGSKVILSPAVKDWFDRNDLAEKELVIRAYDRRDVFGPFSDSEYSEKYKALELEKIFQLVEVEKDETLSDEQRADAEARIEDEFESSVKNLDHEYIKAKYDALCDWFAERGVSAAPYRKNEKDPVISVWVYSIEKDDLIALKDSGLHICYTVDMRESVLQNCTDE